MKRKITSELYDWLKQSNRLPLIIRGARQVGKTWLVREFAQLAHLQLLELNFERDSGAKDLFIENDPKKTILRLEAYFDRSISPANTLLFLDEIQAAPDILAKLRWFAEEMPELAIIATGSLLDFVLSDHTFSMPVGRISYLYLEPMSFEEFLLAQGQEQLCEFLSTYQLPEIIPAVLHQKLLALVREYIFVGGMPAVVTHWVQHRSFKDVNLIQRNIITTYQDDFSKYTKRISPERLNMVFKAIPTLLGKKFKCSAVTQEIQSGSIKNALNLLCMARICHKIFSCAANGIPLSSFTNENIYKVLYIDVGFAITRMGLSLHDILTMDKIKLVNEGAIAEQLVGQLLRTVSPSYIDPELYYWLKEKTGSEAEVDYLIQAGKDIIPIEVKAGATGSLKSLHLFMHLKKLPFAIRINSDLPSQTAVNVKDHTGNRIQYQLLSLPFYLVGQIHRLIDLFKS